MERLLLNFVGESTSFLVFMNILNNQIIHPNDNRHIFFFRQLQTCDVNDMEITVGAVKIIYSWNDADPDTVPLQHITRGVKNLKLVGATREFPAALENTTQIAITAGSVSVPNTKSTVYWCRTIRINQPATKHHIVKFGKLLSIVQGCLI